MLWTIVLTPMQGKEEDPECILLSIALVSTIQCRNKQHVQSCLLKILSAIFLENCIYKTKQVAECKYPLCRFKQCLKLLTCIPWAIFCFLPNSTGVVKLILSLVVWSDHNTLFHAAIQGHSIFT